MTAAGEVVVEEIVVKMVVGLPMSKNDFTHDKQEAFTQGLANTGGVLKQNVRISSVHSVFRRRRRLLPGSIRVSIEVVVEDTVHGETVSSRMTSNNLNTQMSQMGLPELEVLEIAMVAVQVVVAPASLTTPAPLAFPISTAAGKTMVLASTPVSASTSQELVIDAPFDSSSGDDTTGGTTGSTTVIATETTGESDTSLASIVIVSIVGGTFACGCLRCQFDHIKRNRKVLPAAPVQSRNPTTPILNRQKPPASRPHPKPLSHVQSRQTANCWINSQLQEQAQALEPEPVRDDVMIATSSHVVQDNSWNLWSGAQPEVTTPHPRRLPPISRTCNDIFSNVTPVPVAFQQRVPDDVLHQAQGRAIERNQIGQGLSKSAQDHTVSLFAATLLPPVLHHQPQQYLEQRPHKQAQTYMQQPQLQHHQILLEQLPFSNLLCPQLPFLAPPQLQAPYYQPPSQPASPQKAMHELQQLQQFQQQHQLDYMYHQQPQQQQLSGHLPLYQTYHSPYLPPYPQQQQQQQSVQESVETSPPKVPQKNSVALKPLPTPTQPLK